MKKPKDRIFRKGDVVRIVNPEFFVRCGYPLTVKDGVKSLTEDKDKYNEILQFADKFKVNVKSYDFSKLMKILGYYDIKGKRFGGDERKIFTETIKGMEGKEFVVLSKKVVMTGVRDGGYAGSSYYYDDSDSYEPPSLYDTKTHIILYLQDGSVDGTNTYAGNLKLGNTVVSMWEEYNELAIEDIHVEKVLKKAKIDEYELNECWKDR